MSSLVIVGTLEICLKFYLILHKLKKIDKNEELKPDMGHMMAKTFRPPCSVNIPSLMMYKKEHHNV